MDHDFDQPGPDQAAGDHEAIHDDADYIRALAPSIRDVFLFPHPRPE